MEHTIALIVKSHEGDKEARDRLVEENIGLVWSIVRRFQGRGHEMEDLFQIGSIGLIKAIDKFDISYDVKFSTYAVPMITGEIKRFLRDDGMIKVSRSLKETANKARRCREMLNHKIGREPTLEEISAEIGASQEEIVMALDSGVEVESLYKTIYQGDGSDIYLIDKLEEETSQNDAVLNQLVLEQLLDSLTEKEREIILMRYYEDKTQTQVAEKIGISQVQVSRLEKKILQKLRDKL
ncbi:MULTISPECIES: RNA polymerase sporulation sigma factor SigF [Diplocloster]|uniref:RNA polymerase sigma factor n=2 Tax=Diplocloster TaxID=2918511 RepID=A0A949JZ34_9FIRM|nr:MULTISPECIES: RNA polymerase sporulation sigma factor SigF [Lachnospiraceae]SCJ70643.1 Stage II sporulation protein AC [uncultured Clostridium sp.]MBU9726027.1 RNA polymerase sporulation sigma factor SigF [Diplocloster modestus]MBU9737870.1 RNA polymerase sporulation sigma factor SigF [Diplocloster agilis]MBU9744607.1 RNA polymerase sporulation sigma factor SigF [Diplocloster agilis]MCU6735310.1 RNA polymerase sporulation sigma factor SigF [Suonthocola fibrivorans]